MTILRIPLITNGLSIGKTLAISFRDTIRSRKSCRSLLKCLFQLQILMCLISHNRVAEAVKDEAADFLKFTFKDSLKHI